LNLFILHPFIYVHAMQDVSDLTVQRSRRSIGVCVGVKGPGRLVLALDYWSVLAGRWALREWVNAACAWWVGYVLAWLLSCLGTRLLVHCCRGLVRLAEKLWLKVLFANLLW